MAGRGRGATLPAWMTSGAGDLTEVSAADIATPAPDDQFQENAVKDNKESVPRTESKSDRKQDGREEKRTRSSSRRRRDEKSKDRDRKSSRRSRSRESKRRARSPSPPAKESSRGGWKPKKNKTSNFDVAPPDGVELPPVGVNTLVNGVPNSYYSYINPATSQVSEMSASNRSNFGNIPKVDPSAGNMVTRHARRIYAGGIPPLATEAEIMDFFNDLVIRALLPKRVSEPPVIKIYLNIEKAYAFVEFNSIELTTACMQLDGIRFNHYTGTTTLKVRRPNDYRPEILNPESLGPIPELDPRVLSEAGATVSGPGPGKIFIGGLPYNLTDEQVMELLAAFGPIRAFHQVRDPGSVTSKGYGFCEYVNPENAEAAISGLNGMPLGDKTLNVRIAVHGQQQQQQMGMMGIPTPGMGASSSAPMLLPSMMSNGGVAGNGMGMTLGGMTGAVPTRVLKLSNMVTKDDLENDAEYEDIKEDVRLECAEHGIVLQVLIPRARDGFSPASEGHIFVEFGDTNGSQQAAMALNGRKFADQTVIVEFYDESKFAARALI